MGNRIGRKAPGPCCGSAAAAMNYCMQVKKGSLKAAGIPDHPIDAQQTWVGKLLLPHSARLERAKDSNKELPLALFDCQDELMKRIVDSACEKFQEMGRLLCWVVFRLILLKVHRIISYPRCLNLETEKVILLKIFYIHLYN